MSTRAERRLREAQDAHEQATATHEQATAAFNVLDAQADAGELVDPADYATAEGAVKIAAKRVARTLAVVEQEQATVQEERARAVHRELVEAAGRIPVFEEQAAPLTRAITAYAQQAQGNAEAWEAVYRRVLDEIGVFPWEGAPAATAAKVSGVPDQVAWHETPIGRVPQSSGRPMSDRFYLEGVAYTRPSLLLLKEQLTDEVSKIFRDTEAGLIPAGEVAA